MKTLGLLRHAKQDWDDMGVRDFDRDLNARGRKGAALIGEHMREIEQPWDLILASPALRVKTTLELLGLDSPLRYDERLYLASSETIFEVVAEQAGRSHSVLVVGHSPGLQESAMALVPPANENALFEELVTKFPTGALAVVECEMDEWAGLAGARGVLNRFIRPRDLDPSLGPEA